MDSPTTSADKARGAVRRILASGAANIFLMFMAIYAAMLYMELVKNRETRSEYSFQKIEEAIAAGEAVNLAPDMDPAKLSAVLLEREYYEKKADADFAAQFLTHRMDSAGHAPGSVGDLLKRAWQVPAGMITDKCPGLSSRLATKREALEQNLLSVADGFEPRMAEGSDSAATHDGAIRVRVTVRESHEPDTGAYVRLMAHRLEDGKRADQLLDIRRVDDDGWVTFEGLDPALYYSVLPISRDMEYGGSKGTTQGDLSTTADKQAHWYSFGGSRTATFHFQGMPLKVRLFTGGDIKRMRRDIDVTVRTPGEYLGSLRSRMVMVLVAFALLIIAIRARRPDEPGWLKFTAALGILSCISLINMYSLGRPLCDPLYGTETATGILVGVGLMIALTQVNMMKFYMNRYRMKFDPMLQPFQKAFAWCDGLLGRVSDAMARLTTEPLTRVLRDPGASAATKALTAVGMLVCVPFVAVTRLLRWMARVVEQSPKGTGYLLLALLLTCLLFTPLGGSVGGMRVNLDLPGLKVQPSEVSKFLIVVFLAAFFDKYATLIRTYSGHGLPPGVDRSWDMFARRFKIMGGALIGIFALMGVYMVLSDMGPALVILVTFTMFYSLVKSEAESSEKMLQSDVAIMIGGVVTFIAMLWIGSRVGLMWLAAIGWFALWIIVPWNIKRRTGRGFGVYESAVIFNSIIALFIFGGDLLGAVGMDSEAERFAQRMEMCTNTWGVIDLGSSGGAPTSNSQVASGLWALAQGGFSGMGMGMGMQQYVPAFNTDMVLLSFGENAGWIGIALVLALYAMLLSLTLNIGYRSGHTFTLYLCMGIAIVTAVQLLVIIMGSLGLIPLTGVTVALMSYGKASLIMNYAAFGLVASVAAHPKREAMNEDAQQSLAPTIRAYGFPISVVKVTTCLMLVLIGTVILAQATWRRDDVIVRPVYAYSANGMPTINYNPRINDVIRNMRIGNIYDRNGLLLATSDRSLARGSEAFRTFGLRPDTARSQKRYYPFGRYTYFMVGDLNRPLFDFSERFANGYLADHQHFDALRGFDVHQRDGAGRPVYAQLVGERVRKYRFCPETADTAKRVPLYDYRAVVEYVKDPERVKRFNEREEGVLDFGKVHPQDVWLTIDAKLQATMEDKLRNYLDQHRTSRLVRGSVVVLNAETGELLASSNYPPVDLPRLREEIEARQEIGADYYTDNHRPASWTAYTDQDLGLVRKTMPGSSAKVLSGMAFFRANPGSTPPSYTVYQQEIIHSDNGPEPTGAVDMGRAYRGSSNVYFINLINDQHLYPQLAEIYDSIGASVLGRSSYTFTYAPNSACDSVVTASMDKSYEYYNKYKQSGVHVKMNKTQKDSRGRRWYFPSQWAWAWGQNDLEASPLVMARLLSAVANDGKMPVTQYVAGFTPTTPGISKARPTAPAPRTLELITPDDAKTMQRFLKATVSHYGKLGARYGEFMGGKTGTPMRELNGRLTSNGQDGWFVCFIEGANVPGDGKATKLAVAVRLERGKTSGNALLVTRDVVIPTLRTLKYLPQNDNKNDKTGKN